MSNWIIPAGIEIANYEGFVYLIECTITGRKYIGRKYVYTTRKGKRAKESDWRTYFGSSKELKLDIVRLGSENFRRTIVHVCATRADTNYLEVKEQFCRDVLFTKLPNGSREYYNRSILNRYYFRDGRG